MRIRGFAPSTPCWVELTTSDPDDAAGFYAGLFGWQVEGDRFLRNGQAVAGISRTRPDRPEGWLTYLAAPDLAATAERVTRAYGRQLTWPEERRGACSAIMADPSGAMFGLWQAAGFAGAQVRGEPGTMEWADLLTDDVNAATSFYGSVFGWTLSHEFGSGEWLSEAHDSVAGLITGRYDVRWQPSFQVADTTETIDRCAGLGGRVLTGPVEMGLGSYVEMIDPLGAPFAVTAPVHRPVELNVAYNDIIGMELTYGG
ncbi:glyoxalase [Paractinoplanes abujensis]|uniref:Putative enzyme related to lactoylglutathione lyase n=1 Tax=Paractinoplanes abujensis TaxID=882441 RepID=A0A7W7G776_9ACTN|nr:VOC family protein [Actinoplanes abujensis]MBB4698200.1 putative enzyme related to lactoylglutathione lyase [Actinoplanes abujensis]GID19314.1 glyoxalase [Actinoplanes abujensis]